LGGRIEWTALAALLSPSLGDAKADEVVRAAMEALRFHPFKPLDTQQALEVLEQVAQTPGIVGVAARFAKSRVHLMTKPPPAP
jgi:hypothetical protein